MSTASITKGTLVGWTNKNGVKGSGIALSGEDDGYVIVAVNNFGNETPTGSVASKDGQKHSGYHPVVWFSAADLVDIVAEQKRLAEEKAAADLAAKEAAEKAAREEAENQITRAEKALEDAKVQAAKVRTKKGT